MKLKIFGLFVVVAALAVSCGKLQEKPVVDFAMKTFKVESRPNCNDGDSIPCASFEVKYPVFLSLDTTVRRAITEQLAYILDGSPGELKTMEQTGNDFVRDFVEFNNDEPEVGLSWNYKANVEVLIASDTLISLQVSTDWFTGGAHGSWAIEFINVDPKTGTAYLLDAMLRAGYEDELYRLAEADFRVQLGLAESDAMPPSTGPDDRFKLNENYGFRKEGIVFYLNEYDVPSFAEGPTEIIIPYEKLQGWIR